MSKGTDRLDRVLMNDFRAEPEELQRQEIEACQRVIHSGWFILGKEVENFESAWAEKCGSRFAVGTGNGMDAMEIGLRALEIGPGDEVITSAMTAFATVLAILRAGATPVLADIGEKDALLDIASVQRCLSSRTRAVLLVHLYGRVPDMDAWTTFCAQHQMYLLEDCAQAHFARWDDRSAGTFGEWGAFSFYPTKNLGAIGDAGALITASDALALRARRFRNYGQEDRYHHLERGLNSRLDELQAALLSARLEWLTRFTERRREIATHYYTTIRNTQLTLLPVPQFPENHVYHLFVIRCAQRDKLVEHLEDLGIGTLIHYPIACHQQPAGKDLRSDPSGLPNAEAHAASCLSVPCHPQMNNASAQRVVDALNSFA